MSHDTDTAETLCRCWNEGEWGRVHREDCPIHAASEGGLTRSEGGLTRLGLRLALRGLRDLALTESVTLQAPNGATIVVNTPTGRLSVIAAGLDALIADFEKESLKGER